MNFTTILTIHSHLSRSAWLFMLAMALWAGYHYLRNRPLGGNFFGIVAVGEILMLAQALFGLTMLLFFGAMPGGMMHFLYGALSVLILPLVYYTTKAEVDRRSAMIWSATGLFMFGMLLRAISTGPVL